MELSSKVDRIGQAGQLVRTKHIVNSKEETSKYTLQQLVLFICVETVTFFGRLGPVSGRYTYILTL